MRKILLIFCLGLVSHFFYAQSPHCAQGGADFVGATNQNEDLRNTDVMCFKDPTLRNNDIALEMTREQYLSDSHLESLFDQYIDVQIDISAFDSPCGFSGTMNASPRVRRQRDFRGGINTASRNSDILGPVFFALEGTQICNDADGTFLVLRARDINASATSIPTLSQWGLIIFGLLILNMGGFLLLKKNRILMMD